MTYCRFISLDFESFIVTLYSYFPTALLKPPHDKCISGDDVQRNSQSGLMFALEFPDF